MSSFSLLLGTRLVKGEEQESPFRLEFVIVICLFRSKTLARARRMLKNGLQVFLWKPESWRRRQRIKNTENLFIPRYGMGPPENTETHTKTIPENDVEPRGGIIRRRLSSIQPLTQTQSHKRKQKEIF